jgi:hypothetical protein
MILMSASGVDGEVPLCRDRGADAVAAQAIEQVEPVDRGQTAIEDGDRVGAGQAQVQAALAVRSHVDAVALVTWTLHAEGRGTRLLLEHRGFAADEAIQQAARNLMDHGWPVYVNARLAAFLAASDTPSIPE